MSQPDKPRGTGPTFPSSAQSPTQPHPAPKPNASVEPSPAWDALERAWEERRLAEIARSQAAPPQPANPQDVAQVRELSIRLESALRRALPACPPSSGPLALSQLLQFATLSQRLDLVPVTAPELVQALQIRDRALVQLRPNAAPSTTPLTLDEARRTRLTFAKLLQAAQNPARSAPPADAAKPKSGNPANSATGLYRAIAAVASEPEPEPSPAPAPNPSATANELKPSSPLMHPPSASPTPAPHIVPTPSPIGAEARSRASASASASASIGTAAGSETVSIPGLREKLSETSADSPPMTVKLDLPGARPPIPGIPAPPIGPASAAMVDAPDEPPIAMRKAWPQPYDTPSLASRLGRALPWAAVLLLCVGAVFLGQWFLSPEATVDSLRKRAQTVCWDVQSIDPADGFDTQIQRALALLKEAEAQYVSKDAAAASQSYKALIKEGEKLKDRDAQRSLAIAARDQLAKSAASASDPRRLEAGQAAFREGRFAQAQRIWDGDADPSEWKRKNDIFVASNADPKPFANPAGSSERPTPNLDAEPAEPKPEPQPEPESGAVPEPMPSLAPEPSPLPQPPAQPIESEPGTSAPGPLVSEPRTPAVEPPSAIVSAPRVAELTSVPRSEIVSEPRTLASDATKAAVEPPSEPAPMPMPTPMPTLTAKTDADLEAETKKSRTEPIDIPDATGSGLVKKGSDEPDPDPADEKSKTVKPSTPSDSDSVPAPVADGQPTTPKMPDEPDLNVAANAKPMDETPKAPAVAIASDVKRPETPPRTLESQPASPAPAPKAAETPKTETAKAAPAPAPMPPLAPAPAPVPVPSPDTIQRIETAKAKFADLKKRIGPNVPDADGGSLAKRVELMERQATALTKTDPRRGLEAWENSVKDATNGYRTGSLALAKSLADASRHSEALNLLVGLMGEGAEGPEFRQLFQRSAAQAPAWWLSLAEKNLQAVRDPSAQIAANGVLAIPRQRIGNPQPPESRAALLASADALPNPLQSAIAIGSIALAEKAAGDRLQASRIFSQALEKVKTRPVNVGADCQNWWRFTELVQMARDLEDTALWQACIERSFERRPTLEEMKAAFPALEGSDYDQYWVAMYSLLYGNINEATKAAEAVAQRPALSADPYLWCAIARTAAAVGDVKTYEACANRAKPLLVPETLPAVRRDECRSILAMAHALADRTDEARALLIMTQNPEARSQVALTLLRAEARAGRLDRARAALADVTSSSDRGKAVRILGISYARRGEYPAALTWVETLPDPGLRAQAIAGVIEALPALVAVK